VVGVGVGNWIQRYTLRINTDHQILKKLKFSQGLYFATQKEDPSSGGMGSAFRQQPVMAVYDPNAVTNRGWAQVVKGFQGFNRMQSLLDRYERDKRNSINLNGTLTYDILKGLQASVFGGTTLGFNDSYTYVYETDDGARVTTPTISKSLNNSQDYIVTYTLNYDRIFNNHHITALGGYEARKRTTDASGYSNLATLIPVAQSSSLVASVLNASGSFSQTDVYDRILSQFGRVEYTYANKYLLTANVRRDGYGSKFGPANKYGVFPGISVGWVISQEEFLKQLPFINLLKLRMGYGLLGNAVGSDFAYTSYYTVGYAQDWSPTDVNTKQTSIALASQLANPEIKWESVATTNIGIDGVLWNSHLSFNIDYYSRQTKEMLYNVPIAPSAGVGTNVQANVGQMSNKGLEVFLEYRNHVGDFNFTLGVNGGINRNKLISLNPNIEKLYIASGFISGGESGAGLYGEVSPNRSEPGKPLGLLYGWKTAGIYQTDAGPGETRPTVDKFTPQAGDLIFVEQVVDGVMDTKDMVYIGNPWPDLTYGITIGGNWKNTVDIKAIFSGTLGNDIYNSVEGFEHNFFSDYNTTAKIYECSFFGDNQVTDVPRCATVQRPDRGGNWTRLSDYHVQDGSYLQLKNLQLGVTLPKRALNWLGVARARAIITGENLFILTKYKGLTPIVAPYNRSILNQGVELASGRYPFSRLWSLGVNIEF
jgi:TonB-linked SusC/RagA family outer membrane protein